MNQIQMWTRGEGVKKSKNVEDVINGCSLRAAVSGSSFRRRHSSRLLWSLLLLRWRWRRGPLVRPSLRGVAAILDSSSVLRRTCPLDQCHWAEEKKDKGQFDHRSQFEKRKFSQFKLISKWVYFEGQIRLNPRLVKVCLSRDA